MSWTRGVLALGLVCLWSATGQAQTTQTFDGDGTPYTEVNFGGMPGQVMPGGPSGNFYRLAYDGVQSTLNSIFFDQTTPGPSGHSTVDFDFRIGRSGTGGHPADGIGFVLLNTDLYGTTGPGPAIAEEGGGNNSLGLGLDTFDNGRPTDISDNEVSVGVVQSGNGFFTVFNAAYDLNVLGNGYALHNDFLTDDADFDHLHMVLDIDANGATVNVTIIPATRWGIDAFNIVNNLHVPGLTPYPMRAAFGGRTGGATDNHDIDNISVTFSP